MAVSVTLPFYLQMSIKQQNIWKLIKLQKIQLVEIEYFLGVRNGGRIWRGGWVNMAVIETAVKSVSLIFQWDVSER